MVNDRAASNEKTLFESAYVLVTRTRAVIHGVTYQVSKLTRAYVHHQPIQWQGVAGGIFLLVLGLMGSGSGVLVRWTSLGTMGSGVFVLGYFLLLKHRFYVRIVDATGQNYMPLVFRKEAQAEVVVNALRQAMTSASA
jgi:hypothetical protein